MNTDKQTANVSETSDAVKVRRPSGFAAMDRDKVREISSIGGKAAHAMGKAHQFNSSEAREAGRKGGVAPHKTRGRARKTTDI